MPIQIQIYTKAFSCRLWYMPVLQAVSRNGGQPHFSIRNFIFFGWGINIQNKRNWCSKNPEAFHEVPLYNPAVRVKHIMSANKTTGPISSEAIVLPAIAISTSKQYSPKHRREQKCRVMSHSTLSWPTQHIYQWWHKERYLVNGW